MMRGLKTYQFLIAALVVFIPFLIANNLQAQTYTLDLVADTQTDIPDGTGLFEEFDDLVSLDLIESEIFIGRATPLEGIYADIDGTIILVADEFTEVPGGGGGTFREFNNPVSIGDGEVAFEALGGSGVNGIYTNEGGMLNLVANLNTEVPGGGGATFTGFGDPVHIGDGDVAFIGFGGPGVFGIYTNVGGMLNLVADLNTVVPGGGGGTFTSIQTPVSIGNGEVAFRAFGGSGQEGIYTNVGGVLTLVANQSTAVPDGGGGTFTDFRDPVSPADGKVAFFGEGGTGETGIYSDAGGMLELVADENTTVPDGGGGNFVSFGGPVSLGGGAVAFIGRGNAGLRGIYSNATGSLARVADTTTVVPSGGGGTFTLFEQLVSLGGGDVAFIGEGGTGQEGIYNNIGGGVTLVANLDSLIPGGGGETFGRISAIASLGGGEVVFLGFDDSNDVLGIYNNAGGMGMLALVADLSTLVPGGGGRTFTDYEVPVSIGGGDIAFRGFDGSRQEGIYSHIGGMLATVVDLNTVVPEGGGETFTDISDPVSLGDGEVAFRGEGGSGIRGIYTNAGGVLSLVANFNTVVPEGGGGTFESFGSPVSLGNGQVAFSASGGSGEEGIYTNVGGMLNLVANLNTPVPEGGGGTFEFFRDPVSLGGGEVAFKGFGGTAEEGIYTNVGGMLNLVANLNTMVPEGGGDPFEELINPVSLGGGEVAFIGLGGSGQEGIYTNVGGMLNLVANLNTMVPEGGGGTFEFFDEDIASIGGGEMAFRASGGTGNNGIYTNVGGSLNLVADQNTIVPGGGGGAFTRFEDPISIGGGKVAFVADDDLDDEGVYTNKGGEVAVVADQNSMFPGGGVTIFSEFGDLVSLGGGDIAFIVLGNFDEDGIYNALLDTGSLTIIKETDPEGAAGFGFMGTGFHSSCGLDGPFTLDDDEFIECDLIPGEYSVEETNSQGFEITNIDCVGDSSFMTTATSVTVDIQVDDVTVCTFSNLGELVLKINKTGTGTGTVTSEPAGINCGDSCSQDFKVNTVVELTASPDADSDFTGWSGNPDCTDGSVTMDKAKTCNANFTLKQFTLNVAKIGAGTGTVTSVPAGINCGGDCSEVYDINTVVTLNTVNGPVSNFGGWTGDPDCEDGSVTMDSDKTCTAVFNSTAPLPTSADVSVVKSASSSIVEAGSELTYNFEINNAGPNAVAGVDLTDILPEGVEFVSASQGCENVSGTVSCSFGTLSNGETQSLSIVVVALEIGTLTNSATVNSPAPDPNPSNNTSTTTVEVVGDVTEVLSIVTNQETISAEPGDMVSIPVEISNPNGAQTNSFVQTRQTVEGVVFTVDLPEGFVIEELITTQGSCDIELLECDLGEIGPGETVTVIVDSITPDSEGVFNVSFSASTSSGQEFSGSARVNVQGGGTDGSGDGGGCALASTDVDASNLLTLVAPFIILMLFAGIRRTRRGKMN